MKLGLFTFVLAFLVAACGAEEVTSRAKSTSGAAGLGAAGSGGAQDGFGNSATTVPPAPVGGMINADGKCKAGHYLGQLDGLYESSAALGFTPGGIPISTDPMALDASIINALFPPMSGVSPGFEFWLEASDEAVPCASDNEFCFDYKVEGGSAKGVANGLFPFEFEMSGDLNCASGKFEGQITNGWYEVAGIRFMYSGTIEGFYDSDKSAFFDGTWEVTEPNDPNAGGTGSWYTAWVDDM